MPQEYLKAIKENNNSQVGANQKSPTLHFPIMRIF